jgi:Helitron helicase-like domain at N-terminus
MASNIAVYIDNDESVQVRPCLARRLKNRDGHPAAINLFLANPDLPEGPGNKVLKTCFTCRSTKNTKAANKRKALAELDRNARPSAAGLSAVAGPSKRRRNAPEPEQRRMVPAAATVEDAPEEDEPTNQAPIDDSVLLEHATPPTPVPTAPPATRPARTAADEAALQAELDRRAEEDDSWDPFSPDPVPQRRGRRPRPRPAAFREPGDISYNSAQHSLGDLDLRCEHCGAWHFADEIVGKEDSPSSKCCMYGDVDSIELPRVPDLLMKLWTTPTDDGREFRLKARQYNNSIAFTSFAYGKDLRVTGHYKSFSVHGRVYHYQKAIDDTGIPSFAQLFLFDPDYAHDKRLNSNYCKELNLSTVRDIDDIIREHNPWAKLYKHAKEMVPILRDKDQEAFRLAISPQLNLIHEITGGVHAGRTNLPTAPEIALCIPNEIDDNRKNSTRDLVLAKRQFDANGVELQTGVLSSVHVTHAGYVPLHYTLLWPFGEPGWHWGMELAGNYNPERKSNKLSMHVWYDYLLHPRHRPQDVWNWHNHGTPIANFNPLFDSGKLFQQFCVDTWAAVEQTKLDWMRNHQSELRADTYAGLADEMSGDANFANIGIVILYLSKSLSNHNAPAIEKSLFNYLMINLIIKF